MCSKLSNTYHQADTVLGKWVNVIMYKARQKHAYKKVPYNGTDTDAIYCIWASGFENNECTNTTFNNLYMLVTYPYLKNYEDYIVMDVSY